MAVLTRDELMTAIRTCIGEDTSDEALSFIENMEDTINDYENKAKNDGVKWKEKYEQNDKEWRTKYKERFFSGDNNQDIDVPDDKPKRMTFDELFKEG